MQGWLDSLRKQPTSRDATTDWPAQIWEVTLWNFCARFSEVISRGTKSSDGAAKCRLFSQAADWTGAPIENIVQNHLNIALLNVF